MPYVEDNATRDGRNTPSETDLGRMVRNEVETWKPRVGANWNDLMNRVSGGPSPWVVYTTASAALVIIIFAAFLIGSALGIGDLAPQPTQLHTR